MRARKPEHIEEVRTNVAKVRRLSDRLIGVGPFKIGVDGLSAFIPVVGLAYSLGAAAVLMHQAVRARASPGTIATMAAMLAADSAIDALPLPIAPGVADMIFTGHKWAADALLKHIDETHYYPGTRAEAEVDRYFQEEQAARRAEGRRRRVVYLGEG